MPERPDPSILLPLSTSAFHILLALAEGDRHGYQISKDVEVETDGTIRLGAGTLYRLLKQLAADDWIAETARADAEDPRRRYYKLTAWGRRIAQAEAERLSRLVRMARARRLLPAGSRA